MTIHFGKVKPGTKLYIPFHTFSSDDPAASMTITGLATSDIEIYKDGNEVQRASDAGYTLEATDGIDVDGITGIHEFSIDLADDTTANFFSAGSQYKVVVSSITLDAGVINFIAATFSIGYEGSLLDTTVLAYTSQTVFTLTKGPAEADAINGCPVIIHDKASEVQMQIGVVLDYTVTSKSVTLDADPNIFTFAANDNISIMPKTGVGFINGNVVIGAGTSGDKWRGQ